MMYKNQFVAAIKSGNKVLREVGDTVYLPFGCEYNILLKNLNIVRAQVKITIDDQDIGADIIVNPNSEIEIERFLKDLAKGNRFKFIERTSSVEQHRGVGSGDGLIRIEWQFERPQPLFQPTFNTGIYQNSPSFYGTDSSMLRSMTLSSTTVANVNGQLRSVDMSKGESVKAYAAAATNATLQSMNIPASSMNEYHEGTATMDWALVNDVGITVPGSISEQKFYSVRAFPLEDQKHVMVLQLKGETETARVTEPVTVKAKPKCVTCGKVNKATAKFCSNCGTALEIV